MKSVNRYHFDNAKTTIMATVLGNLLLSVCFLFSSYHEGNLWENPFFIYSLMSAIVILVIYIFYDWERPILNIGISTCYLLFCIIELVTHGIPQPITDASGGYQKGMVLDFALIILPFLYVSLRILLIAPILHTQLLSRKVIGS